ncbi:hypothetical protein D3C71_1926080 [compost metagenome]
MTRCCAISSSVRSALKLGSSTSVAPTAQACDTKDMVALWYIGALSSATDAGVVP